MSKSRWTVRGHLIITDDFSKIAYITGECLEGEQVFGCAFGRFELYIKELLNGNLS